MKKIKKGLNVKIMSLLIIVLFIFNSTASYGITAYNKTYLRAPLLGNSDKGRARLGEAISRGAQQNKSVPPLPEVLSPHEVRTLKEEQIGEVRDPSLLPIIAGGSREEESSDRAPGTEKDATEEVLKKRFLKAVEAEDIPDEGIQAMAEHILELADPKVFSTDEARQIRIDGLRENYIPIIERRNGDPKFVVQFNRAMGRLLELRAVQESRVVEDFIMRLLSCRIYIRWTKENFLWMLKEACAELNTTSNEVIGNHPLYGRLSQALTRYRAEWGYGTWKEAISDIGLSPDSLDTIIEKIIRLGKEVGVEIGEGDARRIATHKRDSWKAFVEKLPKEIKRLLGVTEEIRLVMKPHDAMYILIDRPDTWEEFVRKLPARIKRITEISKELNLRMTSGDAMDIVIHKPENWERFVKGMPDKIKKVERLAEKIGFTKRTGIGLSNSDIRYLVIQVSNPERFVIRLPSRIGRIKRITISAGINLAPGDAKYIALYHPSDYRKFAKELSQKINEIMRIGGELGINLSLNDAKFVALREKNPEATVRSLPAKIYNIRKEATRLGINPTERQILTLAIDRPNVFSGILGIAKDIKNYASQELGVELGDARAVELASDYTRAWGIRPEDWRREKVLSSTRAIITNSQKAASVFSDILGRSVSGYEVDGAIERVRGRGIEPIFKVVEREILRKYPILSSALPLVQREEDLVELSKKEAIGILKQKKEGGEKTALVEKDKMKIDYPIDQVIEKVGKGEIIGLKNKQGTIILMVSISGGSGGSVNTPLEIEMPEEWDSEMTLVIGRFKPQLIREAMQDALIGGEGKFLQAILQKMGLDITQVKSVKILPIQEGPYYGVFRGDITLDSGEARHFGLNVALNNRINEGARKDYQNLELLYELENRFGIRLVPQPYTLGTGRFYDNTGTAVTMQLFAVEWLGDFTELHRDRFVNGSGFYLVPNYILAKIDNSRKHFNNEESVNMRIQIISLLTSIFVASFEEGKGGLIVKRININNGDFMIRQNKDKGFDICLITARDLEQASPAEFIDYLLGHEHDEFVERKVFRSSGIVETTVKKFRFYEDRIEVTKGIIDGLTRVYGDERAQHLAKAWFGDFLGEDTISDGSRIVVTGTDSPVWVGYEEKFGRVKALREGI